MKNEDRLSLFRNSLIEAVNVSKSTLMNISKPVYLAICGKYNIKGWDSKQIQEYGTGWTQLKKDALGQYVTDPTNVVNEEVLSFVQGNVQLETLEPDNNTLKDYANFVKVHHFVPTYSTFRKWKKGIRRKGISINELDNSFREQYPEEAKNYLFDKKSWTEEYRRQFFEEVSKHNKFVFVSIGSFCNVDWGFLDSLKQYAETNDAMIIGIPLFKKYDKSISDFCVPPEVRDYMWITFEDIKLNENLMVQVIKASCTTKSTLIGMNQIVSKYDSSIIVGGINQQLKYIPVLKDKTPNLIASTGCCTEYEPVKRDDFLVIPTKAEKLARERLSIKGGLVVELGDNDTFTCRNIEADSDGSFIDLAVKYSPNDEPEDIINSTYVIGDLHAPQHNNVLLDANIKAIQEYNCNKVVLHDSVNMAYVSHHNADKAITKAQMVEEGRADVMGEIEVFCDILRDLSEIPTVEKIIVPYSNHPAHFEGNLQDIGRMTKDSINLRTSLYSAIAMLDKKNVLQYLVEEMNGFKVPKVDWVNEDDGREVYGVQVGLHGSEKVNGGKLTATSTNNAFKKTVMAHKHSAGIEGDTITVGISCDKEQGYNHGLSSWTESSAIVYPNGKVQLLTFVNVKGDYKLWL